MESMKFIRQKELGLKVPKTVVVIGAGGVGTWVSIALTQVGVKKLIVFDSDVVEEHNLNRLPYPKSAVGMKKVEALEKLLVERFDDIEIIPVPYRFDWHLLLDRPEWIVDCTDNYKAQIEHQEIARKYGIKFLRVGTNKHHITVTDRIPKWVEDKENDGREDDRGVCGIIIPQWIAPQMIAAGYAVAKMCGIKKRNVYESIDEKEVKNG